MDYVIPFKELSSTNSTLEKEKILETHKFNFFFTGLLVACLDPYRQYYISKLEKKFDEKAEKYDRAVAWQRFSELLDKLRKREVTGNKAKETILEEFKHFDKEIWDLFSSIMFKKAIGVGVKTVNKVYGKGFIPEFNLMLAPSSIPDITKLNYPTFVQPKLDGFRCLYIPNEGEVGLWSRAGKPFGNKNLKEYFNSLSNTQEYVLDGELYHHDIAFDKLTSILNSENTVIPKGLKFVVYDCVKTSDWNLQECNRDYEDRLSDLRQIVNGVIANHSKVIDIACDLVDSAYEIKEIYKNYRQDGYEGVMIKAVRGKYQWKRVTIKDGSMMKLKPFQSLDLKVTNVYDGEGNLEGKAGGIVVDFNGTAVRVGSGFDLSTRESMAENPNGYLGKTAEIKYFEVTEDNSLRFPTFMRWRTDKDN